MVYDCLESDEFCWRTHGDNHGGVSRSREQTGVKQRGHGISCFMANHFALHVRQTKYHRRRSALRVSPSAIRCGSVISGCLLTGGLLTFRAFRASSASTAGGAAWVLRLDGRDDTGPDSRRGRMAKCESPPADCRCDDKPTCASLRAGRPETGSRGGSPRLPERLAEVAVRRGVSSSYAL